MAATRLLMRRPRELLRLKYEAGLSHRAIAQACAMGLGTVTTYLQRATAAGVQWPLPDALDDAALEARLFVRSAVPPARDRVVPEWTQLHLELKKPGVTLALLWQGDRGRAPGGEASRQVFGGDPRQLCLGRAQAEPGPAVVGRRPRPHARLLSRESGDLGPGQFEERRHDGEPLRTGGEPHVRGPRASLWRGRHSRPRRNADRQTQSRGEWPDRPALGAGGVAPPHVFHPARSERRHWRTGRRN